MLEIALENEAGERMLLSRSVGIAIKSIDGLDPVSSSLSFQQAIRVYGRTYTNSAVSGRDITINFWIEGDPTEAKFAIYRVCRPGDVVSIYISDEDKQYKVAGYISDVKIGYFEQKMTGQIAIQCESPYLESIKSTDKVGSNLHREFTFPFSTTETDRVVFGSVSAKTRLIVQNGGETATGAVFRLRVSQTVTDPKIVNINTGAVMGVSGQLTDDDVLEISTESGHRHIHIIKKSSGAVSNALNRKITGFTWEQVEQGEVIYEAQATGTAKMTLEVSYTEKALGV